jgi:hypothetical protein
MHPSLPCEGNNVKRSEPDSNEQIDITVTESTSASSIGISYPTLNDSSQNNLNQTTNISSITVASVLSNNQQESLSTTSFSTCSTSKLNIIASAVS